MKLGPYEIVAPLGSGGMGEVYRAKDTRLGREVAVKVLPQHLSANAEVRARFEREAKTISSLNHPNICTLFDVGRAPGEAGSGETDYLVMELLEGETLAARIVRGALPPAEVLRIGGQIADALDRAHRAGVIHRDLKPGNVMLTKGGAKLMDFGLARATGLAGPAGGSGLTHAALTQSPTVAGPLTAEGTIVGTFQYMAPEQLEGREADARSDLWALGCVLHEMATGRRAFEGPSQASLIAAIMHLSPPPVSQVAPLAPPALDRVVGACLAKDPADRIQSAHDVKLQLEWIAVPGSGSGATAAPGMPVSRANGGAWPSRVSLAIGVVGLVAAALAGWGLYARRATVVAVQLATPRDLRLSDYWSGSAISPGGDRIVAVGTHRSDPPRLWLWHLESAQPVALPGTEQATFPSWSRDGREIAFCGMAGRAIFRVPVSGGGPTRICDISDPRGLSWGSRNVIVFAPAPSGPLMKVSASGGTPEPATALDSSRGEAGHRFPTFLPDGEHFLFAALPPGPSGFTIRVGSLGSKQSRVLLKAQSSATYVEPGYLVYVQAGKLTAQRFDLRGLRLVGEPFTLDDAPMAGDMDAEPVASGSRDGRLLYLSSRHPDARLEWLDRGGAPRRVVALPEGDWLLQALSPDGRLALATCDGDLWQVDLERAVATRLLRGVDPVVTSQWSPDGRRLVATSREAGRDVLRFLNAGGSGPRDSVASVPALFQEAESWAPDNRSLLVSVLGRSEEGADLNSSWDLWSVPLDGGAPRPYLNTPAFERFGSISPDGRWAACTVRASGQIELFIDSYPVPGHRTQVFSGEPNRDVIFLWGPRARELMYTNAANELMSLPLQPEGDELRAGKATLRFAIPVGVTAIDSRDGDVFLVTREDAAAPGPSLRLVLGWAGLVKR